MEIPDKFPKEVLLIVKLKEKKTPYKVFYTDYTYQVVTSDSNNLIPVGSTNYFSISFNNNGKADCFDEEGFLIEESDKYKWTKEYFSQLVAEYKFDNELKELLK